MAAELTHQAMVAWGEACSKYLALETEIKATYKGAFDDDVLHASDDAWIQMDEAWNVARAAYQAAGQPAAVRILVELSPFGSGDAAEIEAVIDAMLAPPQGSQPGTHETTRARTT
jgi:hypothetical protein